MFARLPRYLDSPHADVLGTRHLLALYHHREGEAVDGEKRRHVLSGEVGIAAREYVQPPHGTDQLHARFDLGGDLPTTHHQRLDICCTDLVFDGRRVFLFNWRGRWEQGEWQVITLGDMASIRRRRPRVDKGSHEQMLRSPRADRALRASSGPLDQQAPRTSADDNAAGELLRSKTGISRPSTSPMSSALGKRSRRANASSTVRTSSISRAPPANAYAATEKARITSITITTPRASWA